MIDDDKCITNFMNITNVCINLGYWPIYFKRSTLTIISKPNKIAYNSLKAFWPIVLLNMLSKPIEKTISKRLQVHSISTNFVYPNQLGDLKQQSTTSASLYITYLIYTGYVKGLHTSTLAFNIAEFFSLLNYTLLPMILDKASFDSRILSLFSNYLINKRTQYIWNNFDFFFLF